MSSTSIRVFVIFLAYLQSANTACPANAKISELKGEEITVMLAEHNKIREALTKSTINCKIVQPQAKTLPNLGWDAELAKKACDVAKTCKLAYIAIDGKLGDKFGCVGQNLWKGSSGNNTANSVRAVAAWAKQCDNYDIKNPGPLLESGTWTQIIWSDTKFVGCCKATFRNNPGDFFLNQLIACNYGPCGNIVGQKPYILA